MKFIVEKEIFDLIPDVCFGVVVAKGMDNTKDYHKIQQLLNEGIQEAEIKFKDKKVKEEADILPYREAFRSLGINPNKYMCSIEALFTRISKGKGMPHINPIVDLGNAISLKYTLPLGAHDIKDDETIEVRLSKEDDTFLPFGSEAEEKVDLNEVVYAVGNQVRTRRWTWRQSEHGKITNDTKDVFFPIDGFTSFNKQQVLEARDALQKEIKDIFGCETIVGFVDKENNVFDSNNV